MAIKKSRHVVARRIHGAYFLIDISDRYSGDTCAIYEINETGMFLWEHIDGARSTEELAQLLEAAIVDSIDFKLLLQDVADFIDTLRVRHFVEVDAHG